MPRQAYQQLKRHISNQLEPVGVPASKIFSLKFEVCQAVAECEIRGDKVVMRKNEIGLDGDETSEWLEEFLNGRGIKCTVTEDSENFYFFNK